MTSDSAMLDRIRKLLAQAEDDAVTPAEAEAFTAKAAELMARYGIDREMLADISPVLTSLPTGSSLSRIRGRLCTRTCSAESGPRCGASASCSRRRVVPGFMCSGMRRILSGLRCCIPRCWSR